MTVKSFGNKKLVETTFTVNDVVFSARLLSLQEEAMLAGVGLDGLDSESPEEMQEALSEMAGAVSQLLQERLYDDDLHIDTEWVMGNLTVADLEGIVEFLRSGEVQDE